MVKKPILVEEALEKLKDFYQKILHVNSLYDNLVKLTANCHDDGSQHTRRWKEDKEEEFSSAWRELIFEKTNFFDIVDIMNPKVSLAVIKSIISSEDCSFKVGQIDIFESVKFPAAEKEIFKAVIYFNVEDNQDDMGKNSSFPHLGLSIILALSLKNEIFHDKVFQVVIARSKEGCNSLVVPKFDIKNLEIHGHRTEIKFPCPHDFQSVLNFVDQTVLALNEYLGNAGLEKLERHFEITTE